MIRKIFLSSFVLSLTLFAKNSNIEKLKSLWQNDDRFEISKMEVSLNFKGITVEGSYDIEFKNLKNSLEEANLYFALPDNSAIHRYELNIGNYMRPATLINKSRASSIFDQIKQTRKDPGLVQWESDNIYFTRVFPMANLGKRRIKIYFSSLIDLKNNDFEMPLAFQKTIKNFALNINIEDSEIKYRDNNQNLEFKVEGKNFSCKKAFNSINLDKILQVRFHDLPSGTFSQKADDGYYYFVSKKKFKLDDKNLNKTTSLHVLWDASRTRMDSQLKVEKEFLVKIHKRTTKAI